MNRLTSVKRAQITGSLVKGKSIRATVRLAGTANNAVGKLAGETVSPATGRRRAREKPGQPFSALSTMGCNCPCLCISNTMSHPPMNFPPM